MYSILGHRLQGVRQIESPNYNERPADAEIDLLVIHCISLPRGQFGSRSIIDLFTNRLDCDSHPSFISLQALQVSAHLLIRRDGELIQFVPFDQRAWHAGVSNYQGRQNCNDFSIGIELEGTDDSEFEVIQYDVLVDVIRSLCKSYNGLNPERIVGHSDIAPGRKTDPGTGFNWSHLHTLLKNRST